MNKYDERLLKLATHLTIGNLGHRKFDFSVFNAGRFDKNGCGTSGCAIGECPVIFKEWEFYRGSDGLIGPFYWPVLRSIKSDPVCASSAEKFFNIDYSQFKYLFEPCRSDDIKRLPGNATKEMVAERILDFVAKKRKVNIYK